MFGSGLSGIIDGLVLMRTYMRVSCEECLDWRIGVMNCRRKGGQTSNIYVRPVDGGEVSTVVGISYVQLANSFEVHPINQSNKIPQTDLPYR